MGRMMAIIEIVDNESCREVKGGERQEWSDIPRPGDVLVLTEPLRQLKVVCVSWIKTDKLVVRIACTRK